MERTDRGGQGQAYSTRSKEMGRSGEDCWCIVLQICEPIFSTGKCIVLDSGFCVSKGITAFWEFGVYIAALIKKRKYWPKGVPGYAIDQYFADKVVTYVDMLEAITEDGPEGKAFKKICFKEPEYVMKIVATWMTV